MADVVRFPSRLLPDPVQCERGQRLADKLTMLLLTHPIAASELEKCIDRLLETPPEPR